jgi:hypothetical protein
MAPFSYLFHWLWQFYHFGYFFDFLSEEMAQNGNILAYFY